MLERKGRVPAKVIERIDRETLHAEVKNHVEKDSNLFADEWRSYRGLDEDYIHLVINHGVEYIRDYIFTPTESKTYGRFKKNNQRHLRFG